MTIYNHTDLLNYLATTFNLQSYLEIGVRKPELNFDKIVCRNKVGVDPYVETDRIFKKTSDAFFAEDCQLFKNWFDLIFIDGLHHADQVKRDFENSLKCLTDHGFIVIHDTLPTHEKYTHVPRDSRTWYGDAYKFACSLHEYEDINFCTVNVDCGCTVVWKQEGFTWRSETVQVDNWEDFVKYKAQPFDILNIYSVDEFINVKIETLLSYQ